MGKYKEVEGCLIKMAKRGDFEVIAHGANCQLIMGSGLAPQMAKAFDADVVDKDYEAIMKHNFMEFDRSIKLGNIDWWVPFIDAAKDDCPEELIVVNCYTQLDVTGRRVGKIDLDYEALTLCMRKMNTIFKGKHIGLPKIGSHLAGGDWNIIQGIIKAELKECTVTIVNYKP